MIAHIFRRRKFGHMNNFLVKGEKIVDFKGMMHHWASKKIACPSKEAQEQLVNDFKGLKVAFEAQACKPG